MRNISSNQKVFLMHIDLQFDTLQYVSHLLCMLSCTSLNLHRDKCWMYCLQYNQYNAFLKLDCLERCSSPPAFSDCLLSVLIQVFSYKVYFMSVIYGIKRIIQSILLQIFFSLFVFLGQFYFSWPKHLTLTLKIVSRWIGEGSYKLSLCTFYNSWRTECHS